jgi:hypothetical protein
MEPPAEDATPELSESLQSLADSDILWSRLTGKFLKRLHTPTLAGESDEIQHPQGIVLPVCTVLR